MLSRAEIGEVLAVIGRHGLPATVAPASVPVLVPAVDVGGLREFCRGDRMCGLFAGAVTAGDLVLPDDDDATAGVLADWHEMLRACVIVEALLVRTAGRLDGLGVRWALTKGAAVAHLDYPDPTLRGFADVDVVVHPDDWTRVLAEFAPDGAGCATRRFTDRFGKGETVLVDDMEVDLHRRFAVGRFGVRCVMGDVFDDLGSLLLAGRTIPVLSPSARMLHACFHASLGGGRGLRALRDVAQIAAAHADAVPGMWDMAERWRVTPVVAAAVSDAWSLLGLRLEHPLYRSSLAVLPGWGDRRALEVFASDPSFRAQARTGLGGVPLWQRPLFVWSAWRMTVEVRR